MKRRGFLAGITSVAVAGCSGDSSSDSEPLTTSTTSAPTPAPTATPSPTPTSTPGPVEMMEVVFVGDYSQQEIQTQLDTVLQLYGLPVTEENYSRLGSVVVSLEEEMGVPEMDILVCMETADFANTELYEDKEPKEALTDAAALCAAQMQE